MLTIIFFGILIALLVVSAIVLFTFLDVAFADGTESWSSSRQWQPPLMRGSELRVWAAEMACIVTNKWLTKPRDKATAIGIAAEVSQGANYAIAQSENSVRQLAPNCPSCRQKMIGVTPPEALLIVETVRKTLSNQKVRRVRELSKQNTKIVANLDSEKYERSEVTCPLWDGNTSCMVFKTRPLQCRGWCSDPGKKGDTKSLDVHAYAVGSGTEDGLSKSLQSSGLDGSVYELNSALTAALDMPAASEQWVKGNAVFEQCKLYE